MTGTDLLRQAERQLEARRLQSALAFFDSAEQAGCDADACAGGRWVCHMLAGHFERAWQESDAIAARGNLDPHRFWDGKPLEGRSVLIRCLHGLGDTIQFIRYAPLLRRRTRRLTIEAQPVLKKLLAASDLADDVITWGEKEPPWDSQVEVLELPRLFRSELVSVPRDVPYLSGSAHELCLLPASKARPKVGLVWASSLYNPARSLPATYVSELLGIPDIDFFSLQAGPERFQIQDRRFPSLFCADACLTRTAAALGELDLVVTVDTMMAHLAGALARPVWTLLPFQGDWRWMLEREDSPWYPTMRLFRQSRQGEWGPVIARLKGELQLIRTAGLCAGPSVGRSRAALR